MRRASEEAVVLFDGDCALCSGLVRLLWRIDRHQRLRFGSLGSEAGQRLLAIHQVIRADTLVLIEEGRALTRSAAVLAIAARLGWPWRIVAGLGWVPERWRDGAYRFVARNRHRWFAGREACAVPPPGLTERCLDRRVAR